MDLEVMARLRWYVVLFSVKFKPYTSIRMRMDHLNLLRFRRSAEVVNRRSLEWKLPLVNLLRQNSSKRTLTSANTEFRANGPRVIEVS